MSDDEMERRLREALVTQAGTTEPALGAWERRRTRPKHGNPRWVLPAAAAAAVVAVAVVISVVASGHADRGSHPPAAVAAASTPSGPASSVTTSGPTPSTPKATSRASETVVRATSAPLSPTPSAPITLVASSLLIRPDCAGTTTGCLQHPQRTFAADGSTSAAARGFGISDVGQGGATISMDDTGVGIITLTNGSITKQVASTAKGPLLYVGATPLAGGKPGIWGVVDSNVATLTISPTTFIDIAPPTMYGLGSHFGFVSNPVPLPLTFSGYDSSGHQLFSVQVTG